MSDNEHVHEGAPPAPCHRIAIPSVNREEALCQQTLTTLRQQEWCMSEVHVFVQPGCLGGDTESHMPKYRRSLTAHGFAEVRVVNGGSDLMLQYSEIFNFFGVGEAIVVMSDTIPSIVWRRHAVNLTLSQLPPRHLQAYAALGFALCEQTHSRAWSLGPCKSPRNMQPAHISRRLGLLDGNCFGIILRDVHELQLQVSGFTTDVELSLRCWCLDGAFHRFLGVTAMHKFRARGGHATHSLQPNT